MTDTNQSTNNRLALKTNELSVFYGDFRAVKNVDLDIKEHAITALVVFSINI